MTRPRILLADDHRMVAQGLQSLLSESFELVGTAADGREMVELTRALQPDAVVVDVSMPVPNGLDAITLMSWKVASSAGANPAEASATKFYATEYYLDAYRRLMGMRNISDNTITAGVRLEL